MTVERVRSVEITGHVGQRVELQGWLHAVRRLGGVTFVILRDGWGTVQAVADAPGTAGCGWGVTADVDRDAVGPGWPRATDRSLEAD
ncbi:OB-fold nucleic acid binding domain-containing protein, partial [Klebsiella pneumoniae]|uniref:OB-fold nucleic acid binding domain-containing protein n=1 Tax=Klebsiella pneumoniae TaxID=573 RepID=UPI00200C5B7B